MRKYLLCAVAASALTASPAVARDNQGYAGLEAGISWVKDMDADVFVDYTTVNSIGAPINTPGPVRHGFNNVFGLDSKMGYNIGIYGGYDFGIFRLEGEIDWMHANLDDLEVDSDLIDALNEIEDNVDLDLVDFGLRARRGCRRARIHGQRPARLR